jgi:hypothetical protein
MPADPLPADPSLSNQASNQGAQGIFYGPVTVQNSAASATAGRGVLTFQTLNRPPNVAPQPR